MLIRAIAEARPSFVKALLTLLVPSSSSVVVSVTISFLSSMISIVSSSRPSARSWTAMSYWRLNSGRSVHQRSIVLREGMPGSLAILFSVSPAAMRSHTRVPTAGLKMWRVSGAGVSARTSIQSALVSLTGFASSSPRRPCASSAASATGVVSCFLRLMVESRIYRNADGLRCGVRRCRQSDGPSGRPLDHPGGAGLLWAINGGRLVELHRDWAVIELAATDRGTSLNVGVSTQGRSRCPGSGAAVARGTGNRCDQKTRRPGLAAGAARGHARLAGDLVQRLASRDALAHQVSDRGAEDVACPGSGAAVARGTCNRCDQKTRRPGLAAGAARGHARLAGDLVQRLASRDALAHQVSDRGAEDVAGVRRRRVGQDLDPVGPCLAHGLCVVLTEEAVCQLRRFCYGRGVVFLAAHGRISHLSQR